jgi:hypothetical protein
LNRSGECLDDAGDLFPARHKNGAMDAPLLLANCSLQICFVAAPVN